MAASADAGIRADAGITAAVTAAFATWFRWRVLRDVASALADALAAGAPLRAGAAYRLAGWILAVDPLRGTGEFVQPVLAALRPYGATAAWCTGRQVRTLAATAC